MSDLHVVFRVGDTEFAIPAGDVAVMESFSGVTPVPGAASWVAGLVQIRGEVVPVIDLRARFGYARDEEASEASIDRRIVVVNTEGRTVGLLVDQAREVLQIAPEQLRDPPEAIASTTAQFIRAVAQAGDRLLMLIDSGRMVGEEGAHGQ